MVLFPIRSPVVVPESTSFVDSVVVALFLEHHLPIKAAFDRKGAIGADKTRYRQQTQDH